ncbi:MAG: DNA-directed RNA polymerase [Methanocellales archaeon]|nr:DNA-directed RNA polymerase [Methanocellales archaeon]
MYRKMRLIDTVRIPPEKLGGKIEEVVESALEEKLEGRIDKTLGSIVVITDVVDIGEGRILVGDGAVYYDVTFDAIVYKPEMQEIVEGDIVEIVEFGAFVSMGPVDGLLHVSQIADDYISYDEKNARLVGKESNRALAEGDALRARIVAVSLNEREPRESKIGLTMRQTALGKLEWLEEARKKEEVHE